MRDGVIVAVGDVRDECDARTEVLDARGNALVPGLVDSHLHPFWGAELARGVDLGGLRTQGGRARGAGRGEAAARLAVRLGAGLRRGADGAGDRRGRARRRRVRAALGPAHRARVAARAASSPRSPARTPFADGSEVVCVDGVPTGELREPGAQDLVLRAAPGCAGPSCARATSHQLRAAERARADRRARDGRRARHARPAARPRGAPAS